MFFALNRKLEICVERRCVPCIVHLSERHSIANFTAELDKKLEYGTCFKAENVKEKREIARKGLLEIFCIYHERCKTRFSGIQTYYS